MVSNGSEDPRAPLVGLTAYDERTRFGVWDLDAVLLPHNYVQHLPEQNGEDLRLFAAFIAACS